MIQPLTLVLGLKGVHAAVDKIYPSGLALQLRFLLPRVNFPHSKDFETTPLINR